MDNIFKLEIRFKNTYNIPGIEDKTVLTMDPLEGKRWYMLNKWNCKFRLQKVIANSFKESFLN